MLQKLSNYLLRIAGWKSFLAALIVYIIFNAGIMQWGAKTFNELSGKKVEVLDLQLTGYSPEQARAILADYTDASRAFAIKFGLIADTFYPMAYTFFFLIVSTLIFRGLAGYGIKTGYLHLFPLLILPVDYMENVGLVNLMTKYPNITDAQIHVANFFTMLKWGLVVALVLIVIGGLITLAVKRFTKAS